jgi:hypothetical protein
MRQCVFITGAFLLTCGMLAGQANSPSTSAPSRPGATSGAAPSMPHDDHGGMSVSVDPYTNEARAKEKFGKANPLPTGILPVEVFIRNETAQPIHINLETIQLEVHIRDERQDIDWLTPVEVASTIAHPEGPPAPKQRRVPVVGIPLPGKDKKVEKLADILKPMTLDGDVVPPMGTIHGFLFFNLSHELSLVPNSSFYLPDAAFLPSNKPLMFFEIPLGPGPPL